MPYAMRLSGWAALGALAVASALFCLSGRLLVGAFDQIPAHMSHTYPALGESQRSLCLIALICWQHHRPGGQRLLIVPQIACRCGCPGI